jgi:hypothetical protein
MALKCRIKIIDLIGCNFFRRIRWNDSGAIAAELAEIAPSRREPAQRVAPVVSIIEGEPRRREAHWGVLQGSA